MRGINSRYVTEATTRISISRGVALKVRIRLRAVVMS
jgi:hypothetical protein